MAGVAVAGVGVMNEGAPCKSNRGSEYLKSRDGILSGSSGSSSSVI